MSERPEALLGLLLALALSVVTGLAAALALLTSCDVRGLGMRVLGSLSACVVFFHRVRSVPLAALVLALLVLLSLGALGRELLRLLAEQRLLRRLPLLPAGDELCRSLGPSESGRLHVLPGSRPVAFCFGLLQPRIVISMRLLELLGEEEREAALWHELAHARRREPLRTLLARSAATSLFWLPVVRDLLDRYLLAKELAADRLALAKTSRSALAGALCGVVDEPAPSGAVGLGEGAAARIERLVDPSAPLPPLFGRRRLVLTLLGAVVLVLLLAAPASVDIGRIEQLHRVTAELAAMVAAASSFLA